MNEFDKRSTAIEMVLKQMRLKGLRHGPVIQVRPLGSDETNHWEIELAHFGESGRSETCDPASMSYQVNLVTDENQVVGFDVK